MHKHDGMDTEERLREIRRTGTLWREYWKNYSDGGKRGLATVGRLEQLEEEGFSWDTVLSWNLR